MSADALLARLSALDVHLEVQGESLTWDAPAGAMTPALLEELRQHKAALVEWFTDPARERTEAAYQTALAAMRQRYGLAHAEPTGPASVHDVEAARAALGHPESHEDWLAAVAKRREQDPPPRPTDDRLVWPGYRSAGEEVA